MAESFAEQLSQFTPDGSGLDRDALLFAAGRASVRRNRGWATLACTLAASQLLTLVLFWPRTPAMTNIVRDAPPAPSVREDFQPASASEEMELRALSDRAFVWEGGIPPLSPPVQSLAPESPPLRAFNGPYFSN
jgi:hypothetical protein